MAMSYDEQQAFNKSLDEQIKKQNWAMTNPAAAQQSAAIEKQKMAAKAAEMAQNPAAASAQSAIKIERPEVISQLGSSALLPQEIKDVLAARKAGLGGFKAEELNAQRAQMGRAQGAAESARNRALASSLSRSGVRGGAAAAATSRAGRLAAQERAAQAEELFIKDIAQKEAAQKAYEGALGGALGQAQKQQFMGLAAGLTEAQLGVSRDIAERQAQAVEKYGTLMGLKPGLSSLI